jgi:hypothetical protein
MGRRVVRVGTGQIRSMAMTATKSLTMGGRAALTQLTGGGISCKSATIGSHCGQGGTAPQPGVAAVT